jgi:hypothetical protein
VSGIGLNHIPDIEVLHDPNPCSLLGLLFPPPVLLTDYSGDAKREERSQQGKAETGAGAILHTVPFLVKPYFVL